LSVCLPLFPVRYLTENGLNLEVGLCKRANGGKVLLGVFLKQFLDKLFLRYYPLYVEVVSPGVAGKFLYLDSLPEGVSDLLLLIKEVFVVFALGFLSASIGLVQMLLRHPDCDAVF